MASPQIENGYTKIANELLEALARTPIRGELWRVLMFVVRKTYGFNKVCDHISLSQFEIGTGLKRGNLCRSLKEIVAYKILAKCENGYKLNKNYNQWIVAYRQPRGIKSDEKGVAYKLIGGLSIDSTQKKLLQKKYTKGDFKKLDQLREIVNKLK